MLLATCWSSCSGCLGSSPLSASLPASKAINQTTGNRTCFEFGFLNIRALDTTDYNKLDNRVHCKTRNWYVQSNEERRRPVCVQSTAALGAPLGTWRPTPERDRWARRRDVDWKRRSLFIQPISLRGPVLYVLFVCCLFHSFIFLSGSVHLLSTIVRLIHWSIHSFISLFRTTPWPINHHVRLGWALHVIHRPQQKKKYPLDSFFFFANIWILFFKKKRQFNRRELSNYALFLFFFFFEYRTTKSLVH